MVRATRWEGRAGLAVVGLMMVGCQASGTDRTSLILTQTPPTVQAAYAQYYGGTSIRSITRETRGGQGYYTFQYAGDDGADHDVVFNEAGNEIDKH